MAGYQIWKIVSDLRIISFIREHVRSIRNILVASATDVMCTWGPPSRQGPVASLCQMIYQRKPILLKGSFKGRQILQKQLFQLCCCYIQNPRNPATNEIKIPHTTYQKRQIKMEKARNNRQ